MSAVDYVLGIGGPYHHDASACLVDSAGNVVAFSEEERFSRRKHHLGSRSCTRSALHCLQTAGIGLRDVAAVAVAWNPHWPRPTNEITDRELIMEFLDPQYFCDPLPQRLVVVDHHVAHAASAFYPSGFADAAVLVADGSGDGASTSIFRATQDGITLLQSYPLTQSLGWLYETTAEHIGLGNWTSAGKMMGLAAYGKPVYRLPFVKVRGDGDYLIDLTRYGTPPESVPDSYADIGFYWALKSAYHRAFDQVGVHQCQRKELVDHDNGRLMPKSDFVIEHANLAASVQSVLEDCLLSLARHAIDQAGSSRLCMAGGVGLNCTANGLLLRKSGARELFVQPAAGDAGCAIGAALETVRQLNGALPSRQPWTNSALGPEYSDHSIRSVLDQCGLPYEYYGPDIATTVAHLIARDNIVGWFQGRAEGGGPRALGQRSILANPADVATRDRINRNVKHRESWRPFAPSLSTAAAGRFVVDPGPAQFMIVAYNATDAAMSEIPAAVHVDGTLRPQVVDKTANPLFSSLIEEVGAAIGTEAVLNTSFNDAHEPIVSSPLDAVRTFFSTSMDALAIGGFLLSK